MAVTKAEIAALIPHGGAMCLLDGVVKWDATHLCSVSRSHHDMANPLRADGELPALCGIEYAMQTMAVHGGLAGLVGGQPRAGYCSQPARRHVPQKPARHRARRSYVDADAAHGR